MLSPLRFRCDVERCHWIVGVAMALLACTGTVRAEDGYALWMRYAPLEPALAVDYHTRLAEVVAPDQTPTQRAAREELERGLTGLTGSAPRMHVAAAINPSLVIGTPQSSTLIAPLRQELGALGDEGYLLRQTRIDGRDVLLVAAPRDIGVLYGVFHLLRLLQTGASLDALEVRESPRMRLRVLNHWDNLDAYVERGDIGLGDLVTHVVVHEIGHHFGLSDIDMHVLEDMVAP